MTEFMPVFHASQYSDATSEKRAGNTYIELAYPNTNDIPLNEEPPHGLDGHLCFRQPPIYPCIITCSPVKIESRKCIKYRVPNRVVRSPDDWERYKAEFRASEGWEYNLGAVNGDDLKENKARRQVNRELREAAIAGATQKQA